MRSEDLLQCWVELRNEVDSLEEAAEIIGISLGGLLKGLERARARGDERGYYTSYVRQRRAKDSRNRAAEILAGWEALPSPKPAYAEAAELIGCSRLALSSTLSRARRKGIEVSGKVDVEAILSEWEFLRDAGAYPDHAAQRLGLSLPMFQRILLDARRRGDYRGNLTTGGPHDH